MNSIRISIASLFLLSVITCSPQTGHSPGFNYDLDHPAQVFELPNSLKEISGITFYKAHQLACIQDEKGKIYLYNLKKREVKESVPFGNDHDYEGIAFVNDTFYVLHSTGTLFEITGFDSDTQNTRKFDTFLKKENNTEGLCYDPVTQDLLIACKGVTHKKEKEDVKDIFVFHRDEGKLESKPGYKIRLHELSKFMADHHIARMNNADEDSFFEPSEIAIHPQTNDIYILSSVGKMIVVLDRSGNIKEVSTINPDVAAHPEGLTFTEDGTMFMSSEGKGAKKVILQFPQKK